MPNCLICIIWRELQCQVIIPVSMIESVGQLKSFAKFILKFLQNGHIWCLKALDLSKFPAMLATSERSKQMTIQDAN